MQICCFSLWYHSIFWDFGLLIDIDKKKDTFLIKQFVNYFKKTKNLFFIPGWKFSSIWWNKQEKKQLLQTVGNCHCIAILLVICTQQLTFSTCCICFCVNKSQKSQIRAAIGEITKEILVLVVFSLFGIRHEYLCSFTTSNIHVNTSTDDSPWPAFFSQRADRESKNESSKEEKGGESVLADIRHNVTSETNFHEMK